MNKIQKEIAKKIFDVLISAFPVAQPIKPLAQVALNAALGDYNNKTSDVTLNVLSEISNEISYRIYNIPSNIIENQGSTLSAANDFISIVASAKIDADLLIKCELDPDILYSTLEKISRRYIDTASAERRGLVTSSLRILSDNLIHRADEIPGIKVAFMRAMLKK